MSREEELHNLELVINQWTKSITGMVNVLDFQRIQVTVSVGMHRGDDERPPRGEIIIRISPVRE